MCISLQTPSVACRKRMSGDKSKLALHTTASEGGATVGAGDS